MVNVSEGTADDFGNVRIQKMSGTADATERKRRRKKLRTTVTECVSVIYLSMT